MSAATGVPGAHGEVRLWTEIDQLEHLEVDRLRLQQQEEVKRLKQQHEQQKLMLKKMQTLELDRLRQQLQQQQDLDRRQQQQVEQTHDLVQLQQQELNQLQQQQLLQEQQLVVKFKEYNRDPLDQAKNLLWIEQNPLYKTALDDWDRRDKLLTERVDRMEKRSGDLKNEIYQLVGFFTVLQGVVLTAVTQMTQSTPEATCKKVWSPVLLTLLAWIVTCVSVGLKLKPIVNIDNARKVEDSHRKVAVHRALMLRNEGPTFIFGKMMEKDGVIITDSFKTYFFIIVMVLSVFTGVFVASYFLILCNRGLAPIAYSPFN